jgi:hypothetical protein
MSKLDQGIFLNLAEFQGRAQSFGADPCALNNNMPLEEGGRLGNSAFEAKSC